MNDCDCKNAPTDPTPRRRVIRLAAAGVAIGLGGIGSAPARAAPTKDDRLVADDVQGEPVALRPADLTPGKPLLAFAFDPKTKEVRNTSRLHKLVLVKFAESELDAETKQRAAGGVLAYSAICTHQACEVKTWVAKEKALVCFCHASKFLMLEKAKVADGPASRALPSLPLALKEAQLVVAGTFSAKPGPG